LALQGLTDQVVAGFAPNRVPKVSSLNEPAMHWDDQEKRWQVYSQFGPLSAITGSYHQELGRLFWDLKDVPLEGARAVDYRQHYATQQRILQGYLNDSMKTWPDSWAVFRVPNHGELTGRERAALDEILRVPFAQGDEEQLSPADLPRLASLPLYRVKQLAQHAAGCHSQNFDERYHQYYRLDCYTYAPRREGLGAELRIEIRLVYASDPHRRLEASRLPSEIYFHFLMPDGTDGKAFREEVMTGLATAVRRSSPQAEVRSTDKGGSVVGGFVIDSASSRVHVLRPAVVSLTGITPEPNALMVRVTRAGG
jgi:hypothetical protein